MIDILIIATGSEVELALEVYQQLVANDKKVQLVSMPSTSIFDKQELSYKKKVLPNATYKIAIEMGVSDFWFKYVGLEGLIIGLDKFGESAKAQDLFEYFGFTVEKVLKRINKYINTI